MLGSYTILEFLLALAVFILVSHELSEILRARREGLSTNVSRVVLRVTMLMLLVVYAVVAYAYLPLEVGEGGIQEFGTPTAPWGYLLLGGLLMILAGAEALGIMRARQKGLTQNRSRLVLHTVSFLVLLTMLGLAVRKWDRYLERLDITIVQGPPGAAEVMERRARFLESAQESARETEDGASRGEDPVSQDGGG
jgi:hypothetical protein